MTPRRVAFACLVFSAGMAAGLAVLRPAHRRPTAQERAAASRVAAAGGGRVVHTSCAADHCGVVVRRAGATSCDGWIVPLARGTLGTPRRTASVDC